MPTTTTNYSLLKPLVNDPTDADQWGTQLNANMDTIDSTLKTISNATYSNVSSKTANYTVVSSDRNSTISVDATGGAITISLTAAATLGDGFEVTIKKTDTSTNYVTIDPNSTETIDTVSTYPLTGENYSVTLVCDGANWKIKSLYSPAAISNNIKLQSSTATTSGTTKDYVIPSAVKRINVMFMGVSMSGSDNILVQIGSSSTPATSGYSSASGMINNAGGTYTSSSGAGFIIRNSGAASSTYTGAMSLSLSTSSNTWVETHNIIENTPYPIFGAGNYTAAGEINILRLTVSGSNTFDAGSFSISWEF